MSEVRISEQFDLSRFLDNPSFAHTVKLILENGDGGEKKEIIVSGVVLAQFSEYFEELLSSGVSEVVVSSNPLLFSKDVQLKEFLRLLSGGSVEINKQNVSFFVKLGISYGIKKILVLCYKWLTKYVDNSNVLLLVEISLMFSTVKSLKDRSALTRFYAHTFLSSDFDIVLDILKTLSLDPLVVLKSEETERSSIRTLLSQNEHKLLAVDANRMEQITLKFSNILLESATESNVETLKDMVKDQNKLLLDLLSDDRTLLERKSPCDSLIKETAEEMKGRSWSTSPKLLCPINLQGLMREHTQAQHSTSSSKVINCDSSDTNTSTRTRSAAGTGTALRPATAGGVITHFCETYLLEPVNDQSNIAIKEFNDLIGKSELSRATRGFFTKNLQEYAELFSEDSFQHFIIQNYISNARFTDLFRNKQEYLVFLLQLRPRDASATAF